MFQVLLSIVVFFFRPNSIDINLQSGNFILQLFPLHSTHIGSLVLSIFSNHHVIFYGVFDKQGVSEQAHSLKNLTYRKLGSAV